MNLDDLSPDYIRERRIKLTLDPSITSPRVFSPVLVKVDYAETLPEGVQFPLVFEVRGPSVGTYETRVLYAKPTQLVFTPHEGGPFLVVLREFAHNRWFGSLHLEIAGESLAPLKVV